MNDKIKYFIPKIKNRIPSYVAKFSEHLPVDKISLMGIDSITGKADFLERLEAMLGVDLPSIVRNAAEEEHSFILRSAEETKQHIFNVLGSGPVKMESINWSREIKTGFEWPVGVYYLKIRALTPKGSDIKIPWEISRCHHLLWMAEAYCLTGDESYAEEVVEQMRHWIEHNPLMYSVNWTCAMDVSIRAVNWMYTFIMIGTSKTVTDEFAKEVFHSLYQHLFFINRNLEKCVPYSNNHYFSDIVGQLFLGQLFSTTRCGKRTLRRAIKEYCKEVEIQVFPSGVNYERSISYHRLMTELVIYPYYMLIRTGHTLPKIITDRLSHMLGYINQYTMGNGCSPIVSDNDDGRLLPLVPIPFVKHAYLVNADSLDSRLVSAGCEWLAPVYGSIQSDVHADANLAILKKDSMYVFASCFHRWRHDVFKNSYIGTHLHNDLLSFVFADGDTPVIVDAGAYCYTSDFDTWESFRTAKKHNTIIVDDEEPNKLGNSAFLMKYNSNAKPMVLLLGDVEHCEGEYTTIEGQMIHRREFDLASDCLKITDHLTKTGARHKAYMSFHFAESVETTIEEGQIVMLSCGEKKYKLNINFASAVRLRIEDDTLSPSFGVLVESKTLVVEFEFDEHADCVTVIERQ